MISLNKTVTKKYAYVKNEVIFDIKTSDNGDACVVNIDEQTVPSITVGGEILYFNGYIEDGDTYKAEDGKFKKTVHSEDGEEDITISYSKYYRMLCEKEIAKSIMNYYTYDYQYFINHPNKLNVPVWILSIDPTEVTGLEGGKIVFTENYYNDAKENSIKSLILHSAKSTANNYGYELTNPSKEEDLEIEEITE